MSGIFIAVQTDISNHIELERAGWGSLLYTELEKRWQLGGVNLVLLFPAANVAAPKFWEKNCLEPRGRILLRTTHTITI